MGTKKKQPQRGDGAGRVVVAGAADSGGGAGLGAGVARVADPGLVIRSIVSTSKATPVARRALVTASAGAEGSASGSRIVTRYGMGRAAGALLRTWEAPGAKAVVPAGVGGPAAVLVAPEAGVDF